MSDSAPPKVPRPVDQEWVTGKLLAHGKAPYLHNSDNRMSYYVRLLTRESAEGARQRREFQDRAAAPIDGREEHLRVTRDSGGTRTLWGVDLERAVRESRTGVQVNQDIGVRVRERRPVFDAAGHPVPNQFKNIYEVERLGYLRAREANARKLAADHREGLRLSIDDPAARSQYRLLSAAAAYARQRYPDNEEFQTHFLDGVKRMMAQSPGREKLIAAAAQRIQDKKRPPPTPSPGIPPTPGDSAELAQREPPLTLE